MVLLIVAEVIFPVHVTFFRKLVSVKPIYGISSDEEANSLIFLIKIHDRKIKGTFQSSSFSILLQILITNRIYSTHIDLIIAIILKYLIILFTIRLHKFFP